MTTTAKKPVSKFFRVAVEGATSDGRVIDRETTVDGVQLYPSILNAKPFEVGSRRWWVVVASPLDSLPP